MGRRASVIGVISLAVAMTCGIAAVAQVDLLGVRLLPTTLGHLEPFDDRTSPRFPVQLAPPGILERPVTTEPPEAPRARITQTALGEGVITPAPVIMRVAEAAVPNTAAAPIAPSAFHVTSRSETASAPTASSATTTTTTTTTTPNRRESDEDHARDDEHDHQGSSGSASRSDASSGGRGSSSRSDSPENGCSNTRRAE